jgi:hypothetical protein
MKERTTVTVLVVAVGIVMWRVSVAGVTVGLGGHRILPASPVTAFAVMIIGIPLAYLVIGMFGRWR